MVARNNNQIPREPNSKHITTLDDGLYGQFYLHVPAGKILCERRLKIRKNEKSN